MLCAFLVNGMMNAIMVLRTVDKYQNGGDYELLRSKEGSYCG
jgi:hypothetical protein